MVNYLIIAVATSVILLIWAILATFYAIQNGNKNNNCANDLEAANSNIDRCNKFCGSAKNWAKGQITNMISNVNSILVAQNLISCTSPTVDYPKLEACAVDSLADTYSYWDLSNSTKIVQTVTAMDKALDVCLPTVPTCKKSV